MITPDGRCVVRNLAPMYRDRVAPIIYAPGMGLGCDKW
jgi:hypothetical protein